ncbi:GspH/FimT family pseudopilin [Salinithrix halophila]|uniref:GspH/FimT family pseudopilin n=1 Tax=Salinithrix halophila TaxID=1485204 RepID=A0ABV8JDF0_9BACL
MTNRLKSDEEGWTLVELALTLSLIGLLVSLAVPAFVQWGDRLERELFLGGLAEDLRLAQREARLTEEKTVLQLDEKRQTYTVKKGRRTLRREAIPPRYKLTSNYPGNRVTFRPTGQVRGGTFRLVVGSTQAGRVIVQVASGRPKVEVDP